MIPVMQRKLFSVTAKDCDWEYSRGSGKGGQKRNKTSSKVRCIHRASGASAVDDSTRSQHQNKRGAFLKMVATNKFQAWHKVEIAKRLGLLKDIEKKVEQLMVSSNLKIEVRENNKWVCAKG